MSSAEKKPGRRGREGDPPRGLPSITEARQGRRKATVPTKFWVAAAVLVGVVTALWWKIDSDQVRRTRNDLLVRQRELATELGPKWYPVRDLVEGWAVECARDTKDLVDPEVGRAWDFRKLDGLYVRFGRVHGEEPDDVRAAAQQSLHDAFTTCLFLQQNPSPLTGTECETTRNCGAREVCNEFKRCAQYSQPFNLSLAYRTLKVLSREWVEAVQDETSHLALRGATATFDDAVEFDIPIAVDLLARAKFFMAVVDEPAEESGADAGVAAADAGVEDPRGIPSSPHWARVCIYRLEDRKKMLSIRREASGGLQGPSALYANAETRRAQQMQVNSCALAMEVRSAIGDDKGELRGPP